MRESARARAWFISLLAILSLMLGWKVPIYSFAQFLLLLFILISAIGIEFDLRG